MLPDEVGRWRIDRWERKLERQQRFPLEQLEARLQHYLKFMALSAGIVGVIVPILINQHAGISGIDRSLLRGSIIGFGVSIIGGALSFAFGRHAVSMHRYDQESYEMAFVAALESGTKVDVGVLMKPLRETAKKMRRAQLWMDLSVFPPFLYGIVGLFHAIVTGI